MKNLTIPTGQSLSCTNTHNFLLLGKILNNTTFKNYTIENNILENYCVQIKQNLTETYKCRTILINNRFSFEFCRPIR